MKVLKTFLHPRAVILLTALVLLCSNLVFPSPARVQAQSQSYIRPPEGIQRLTQCFVGGSYLSFDSACTQPVRATECLSTQDVCKPSPYPSCLAQPIYDPATKECFNPASGAYQSSACYPRAFCDGMGTCLQGAPVTCTSSDPCIISECDPNNRGTCRRYNAPPVDCTTTDWVVPIFSCGTTYTVTRSVIKPATCGGGCSVTEQRTAPACILITCTVKDAQREYGEPDPAFPFTCSGFTNGDTQASVFGSTVPTTQATTTFDVGRYAINLVPPTSLKYTFSIRGGILTITPRAVTCTADNKDKAYNAPVPALTYTCNRYLPGYKEAAAGKLTTTATQTSLPNTYPITFSQAPTVSSNYNVTTSPGTLTIQEQKITCIVDNLSRAYGAANPVLTYNCTGLPNGVTAQSIFGASAISTTATTTSKVGKYAITLVPPTSGPYTFAITQGVLDVTQPTVTCTADSLRKSYNSPNPPLTYQCKGFANGDTELTKGTLVTTAVTNSLPNGYPITFSTAPTVSTNYKLVTEPGVLTVDAARCGDGLINAPTEQCDGATLPAANPSSLGWLCTSTCQLAQDCKLSINKCPVTITWGKPSPIYYGTKLSDLQLNAQATSGGTTVAGTFTYKPVSGALLPVGTHTLETSFVPTDTKTYQTPPLATTTLDVLQQTLTCTPNSVKIAAGSALPAFTFSCINGYVNNEGPSVITNTPQITVDSATTFSTSTVGNYNLVFSTPPVSANYKITVNPGSLSIYSDCVLGTYKPVVYCTTAGGTFTQTQSILQPAQNGGSCNPQTKTVTCPGCAVQSSHPSGRAALAQLFGLGANDAVGIIVRDDNLREICKNSLGATSTSAVSYANWQVMAFSSPANNQFCGYDPIFSPATTTNFAKVCVGANSTTTYLSQLDCTCTPPVNCVVGDWVDPANKPTCGSYTQTRSIIVNSANGGAACPALTQTVTLAPCPPATCTINPTTIDYGTGITAAQLNTSGAGTFSFRYKPLATGAFTTLAVDGSVKPNAGSYTVEATMVPTDKNLSTTTCTGTLTVNKQTPTCTWPAPADMTSGATLSTAQLNAVVKNAAGTQLTGGTFAYSPLTGTVMIASSQPQTLNTTWSPSATDAANYKGTTCTTAVNVTLGTSSCTVAPNPVSYGIGISTSILNPTGAGTFTYTYKLKGSTSAATALPADGSVKPAVGSYDIEASFTPTDKNLAPSKCTGTLTVGKATPQCSWGPIADITYGTALSATQLNASVIGVAGTALTGGTGTYNPVAGTKPVVGTQALSYAWTPSATDAASYNGVTCNNTVKVTAAASGCTITPNATTFGTGITATILNATGAGTFTYTYKPAGSTAAATTLTADGTVKPAAGSYTVEASFTPTDKNLAPSKCTGTLTIGKATPQCSWGAIADITYGTVLSATQLNASVTGVAGTALTGGTGSYDPALGTKYNASATPYPLLYIWTPSTADAANYNGVRCTNTIKVTPAASSCTVAPTGTTFGTGITAAILNATGAGTFTYTYKLAGSTATAAALAADGTVKPAVGSYTIEASFTPTDTNLAPSKCTGTLTVGKATPQCSWGPIADITYGTALSATQLNASVIGVAGTALTGGTGTYNPVAGTKPVVGTQAISYAWTPSATDAASYNGVTCNNTVKVTAAASGCTITPNATTFGTGITATILNATGAGTFTYTYKPAGSTAAATTLTADGTVKPAAGSYTVEASFTPTDKNLAPSKCTGTLTVGKATPQCSWGAIADITYGTALSATQLNASVIGVAGTALTGGTGSYDPALGTKYNASATPYPLLYIWTPSTADAANYNGVRCTNTIKVTPAASSCTVAPTATTFGTGITAAILNATGAGTFTYTYKLAGATATAAALAADGTVKPAVGSYTIEASFTPTDTNLAPSKCTGTLTVGKATPQCSWGTIADITYGTALSATQLNASVIGVTGTALTGGTGTYNPVAGTKPVVGTQALSYAWTPSATDAASYNGVTCNNTVKVIQAAASCTISPVTISYGTGVFYVTTTPLGSWTYMYKPAGSTAALTSLAVDGTVKPAVGSYSVQATFKPTDTNIAPSTCTNTLTVTKATPSCSWGPLADITYGTALSTTQLFASVFGVNGNITGGTGTYTPAAGTKPAVGTQSLSYTWTPSATDAASYNSVTCTNSVKVTPAASSCTVAPTATTFGTGITAAILNATGAGTFTYTYKLAGSTATAAALAADGSVKPAVGSYTIEASFTPTDTNLAPSKCTGTLTVGKATPQCSWGTIADITYGTALSATQLNASVIGVTGTALTGGTGTYNPVAGTKPVVGTQALSYAWTPSATDSASYNGVTCNNTVKVTAAASSCTVAPTATSYGTGITAAILNATGAGTFTYTYKLAGSTASAAALAADGSVKPAAGSYSIEATFTPTDKNLAPSKCTGTLTVGKATPQCSWGAIADITYGTTLSATQLNASVIGVAGTALTGGTGSYDPALGTKYNASATPYPLLYIWTPSTADAANYNGVRCTNTIKVTPAASSCTVAPTGTTFGTGITAAILSATGAGTFTYTYKLAGSTATAAALAADGTVKPAVGSYTIEASFTPTDTNLAPSKCTGTLTVGKATPQCSWGTIADITYGTALSATQLNASVIGVTGTALTGGTGTYNPVAGTKPVVGTQAISYAWTPSATDAASYNGVTCNNTVKVTAAASSCTVAPKATNYGTGITDAILNATGAGTFTYTYKLASSTAAPATLTANGTVRPYAGTYTIEATFTPTDTNLAPSKCTGTLVIGKTTPICNWNQITDITYGTVLSATQLNASVNGIAGTALTGGTGTYNPVAGTKPNVGNQALSYAWTPSTTDAANYNGVTCNNTVKVTAAASSCTVAPNATTYGQGITTAILNATGAGTFTYTYKLAGSTATAAALTADGSVKPAAGSYTIEATFTPSDKNLAPSKCTGTLTVGKATPTCNWPPIALMPAGTALGATQLNAAVWDINATPITDGSFTYTPAAGAVLPAGQTSTIYADWKPGTSSAANYLPVRCDNKVVMGSNSGCKVDYATAPGLQVFTGFGGPVPGDSGTAACPAALSSIQTQIDAAKAKGYAIVQDPLTDTYTGRCSTNGKISQNFNDCGYCSATVCAFAKCNDGAKAPEEECDTTLPTGYVCPVGKTCSCSATCKIEQKATACPPTLIGTKRMYCAYRTGASSGCSCQFDGGAILTSPYSDLYASLVSQNKVPTDCSTTAPAASVLTTTVGTYQGVLNYGGMVDAGTVAGANPLSKWAVLWTLDAYDTKCAAPAPTNKCTGVVCNDNKSCTNDSCDPSTGQCVFTPNGNCDAKWSCAVQSRSCTSTTDANGNRICTGGTQKLCITVTSPCPGGNNTCCAFTGTKTVCVDAPCKDTTGMRSYNYTFSPSQIAPGAVLADANGDPPNFRCGMTNYQADGCLAATVGGGTGGACSQIN